MSRALAVGALLLVAGLSCRPWDTELADRLKELAALDAGAADAGPGDAGVDAGFDAGPPCQLELCFVDKVSVGDAFNDNYFDVSLSSGVDDVMVLGWGVIAVVDGGQWDTSPQAPFVAQGYSYGNGRPGAAWVTDTKTVFHLGAGAPTRFTTCGGVAMQWQNVTALADGSAWASGKSGAACWFPPSGAGQFFQIVAADAGVALVSVVATDTGAFFGADNAQIYLEDGGVLPVGAHLGTSITALGGSPSMGYWAGTDQGEVLALDAGTWSVVWVDTSHNTVSQVLALSADDVWAASGIASHMGTDHLWADYPVPTFFGNLTGFSGDATHLVAIGYVRNNGTGVYDAIAYRYKRGAVIP